MIQKLPACYQRFADILSERFEAGTHTTEDAIRFCFHLALLQEMGISHQRLILEYPHPTIKRAKVDTWLEPAAGDPGLAVEFKYDREIPSEGSVNKTQRAGAAFHDLYRLTGITEKYIRVFIYVASPAMNEYFNNERNRLAQFYNQPIGVEFTFARATIDRCAKVLVEAAGPGSDLHLTLAFKQCLPADHEVRVYHLNSTTNPML